MLSFNKETSTITVELPENKTIPQLLAIAEEEFKNLNTDNGVCGKLLKITGRCPVIIGAALMHHVVHLFGAIAFFSPADQGFVVTASHNPSYKVGDVIR